MQKITPFLWFDDNAEEAITFYTSVFKDAKIITTTHFTGDVPGPKGKVMTIEFEMFGQRFSAINGGPGVFSFTGAISFVINCEDQNEVDYYWEKLSEGGNEAAQQCGWLADKYGVYWQVTPTILPKLMSDPDTAKAHRVTQAMLQMKKIDIPTLMKAYEDKE